MENRRTSLEDEDEDKGEDRDEGDMHGKTAGEDADTSRGKVGRIMMERGAPERGAELFILHWFFNRIEGIVTSSEISNQR
ncbi:hypothetical protein WAI453_011043 [Rhynchosporium graminicola]